LAASIQRGPETEPLVCEVADRRIDGGNAGPAVDHAFADVTARIDAQPQEDGRTARPLVEQSAREVAPAEHRRREMRRFRNPAVATPARSTSTGSATGAGSGSTRSRTRTAHIRRTLGRRRGLARSLGSGDPLHRRVSTVIAIIVWLGFTAIPVAVFLGLVR